ncbi:phosphotransferase [Paenibacillus sp. N1-5-1-14]|uniref:phosphotransferase enzyme family protein n=1 Tax=Paenibacillus radicibacter TaxID=2972488 RepID=UPI002158CD3F|nr:phosphotransferase [Paenibacillus radicibacter]MCR8644336.1 phosphotransferase [Paenibacillus radicibacter]
MLKLKYLFNNEELAMMILRNWEFDEESVEMFQYYRISSNAIYPFRIDGKIHLLRFAPIEEKKSENVKAELAFIAYLRDRGYGVLETTETKQGEELIEVETPWGTYVASVFKRVRGTQLNRTDLSDEVMLSYGKALGKLHQLSGEYKPEQHRRWTHEDVIAWMKEVLKDFPQETTAMQECELVLAKLSSFNKNNINYGLIHYDFEFDNVFYDQGTGGCNAIDFDDSMYHWYVMDVEQSLDSLHDVVAEEVYEAKKAIFLEGYRSEYALPYNWEELLSVCRQFNNLYGYVRTLHAMSEKWANEPEWLTGLRARLEQSMEVKARQFGVN